VKTWNIRKKESASINIPLELSPKLAPGTAKSLWQLRCLGLSWLAIVLVAVSAKPTLIIINCRYKLTINIMKSQIKSTVAMTSSGPSQININNHQQTSKLQV
jgi:hypothetical protein